MKMLKLALIGATIALAGCAASGPKFAAMEASAPKLKPEQGRVYFYRNSGFMGAAVQPAVMLDGAEVGTSKPGGYFYADVNPGSHVAMTSTEATNKVSFVLAKGEVKYVRTSPSFGLMVGHIVPELVGADEATKELSELSYIGNSAK